MAGRQASQHLTVQLLEFSLPLSCLSCTLALQDTQTRTYSKTNTTRKPVCFEGETQKNHHHYCCCCCAQLCMPVRWARTHIDKPPPLLSPYLHCCSEQLLLVPGLGLQCRPLCCFALLPAAGKRPGVDKRKPQQQRHTIEWFETMRVVFNTRKHGDIGCASTRRVGVAQTTAHSRARRKHTAATYVSSVASGRACRSCPAPCFSPMGLHSCLATRGWQFLTLFFDGEWGPSIFFWCAVLLGGWMAGPQLLLELKALK